ncbi:MAG: hypothetical protein ACRDTQ_03260 [Micromonosporaceae bacterium]
MARNDVMELFRAAVRHDWDDVNRLTATLDKQGWPGGVQGITAVFALTVDRRFTPGYDVRQISEFVAEVRGQLSKEDDVDPLAAEGLIRSVLGETELAEGIPADIAMHAQIVLALKMIEAEGLSDLDLERFLDEAETLVSRWSQSGS